MMEQIDNILVTDWWWDEQEKHASSIRKKLNSAGYTEMGTGIFVPEKDAYQYALERISLDEDLKREFVEWFYSGNWIKED